MQAVILAAGRGKRLAPLTNNTPKPLLKIGEHSMLAWTLSSLPEVITEALVITGYLEEQIKTWVVETKPGLPINFFTQNPLNGTDGAVRQATKFGLIKWPCLVVNGDDLYHPKDLAALCHSETMSMLVSKRPGPLKASVQMDENNLITGLADIVDNSPAYECSGAYFLTGDYLKTPSVAVNTHAGKEYSLPHTLAAASKKFPIHPTTAWFWQRVGTISELENANQLAKSGQIPIKLAK